MQTAGQSFARESFRAARNNDAPTCFQRKREKRCKTSVNFCIKIDTVRAVRTTGVTVYSLNVRPSSGPGGRDVEKYTVRCELRTTGRAWPAPNERKRIPQLSGRPSRFSAAFFEFSPSANIPVPAVRVCLSRVLKIMEPITSSPLVPVNTAKFRSRRIHLLLRPRFREITFYSNIILYDHLGYED